MKWCFNYLSQLGQTACEIPTDGWHKMWLVSGPVDGAIFGRTCLSHQVSSYWYVLSTLESYTLAELRGSSDVSRGVGWVVQNCPVRDGRVQGTQAAWGNGNLIVGVGATYFYHSSEPYCA